MGMKWTEEQQKIDKCCFSATGRAYNGDTLSWLCVKVEMLDQRFFFFISESDILNIYCSFYMIKSSGWIRAFRAACSVWNVRLLALYSHIEYVIFYRYVWYN